MGPREGDRSVVIPFRSIPDTIIEEQVEPFQENAPDLLLNQDPYTFINQFIRFISENFRELRIEKEDFSCFINLDDTGIIQECLTEKSFPLLCIKNDVLSNGFSQRFSLRKLLPSSASRFTVGAMLHNY